MKLSVFKSNLVNLSSINFRLPDESLVPTHFHVTEVGIIHKQFIDCGGTIREEQVINFQLWNANDVDHQLKPSKLLKIIELAEAQLPLVDAEIEVEYQAETIGKFGLDFDGSDFLLTQKQTACLASDKCGIPAEQLPLASLEASKSCCTPGGSCC